MTRNNMKIHQVLSNRNNTFIGLATAIDPTPVDLFSNAKLPTTINVCNGLPCSVAIKAVPLAEFESKHKVTWCVSNIIGRYTKYYIYPDIDDKVQNLPDSLARYITHPPDCFAIAYMGQNFGFGTFAQQKIPAKTSFIYAGEYSNITTSQKVSQYCCELIPEAAGKAVIDAENYRNYSSYMQHLPNNIAGITFQFPEIAQNVATANIEVLSLPLVSVFSSRILRMRTTREIDNEIVGFDYGDQLWLASDKTPALFDKKGRWIPPALYHGDIIWLRMPEIISTALEFDRNRLLTHLRDKIKYVFTLKNPDKDNENREFTLQPQDIRKYLQQNGFIPTPDFKKTNPLDLEYELRQAASDGRFSMVEYLLDWHSVFNANDKPVNVNAINTGKESSKEQHYIMPQKKDIYTLFTILQQKAQNFQLIKTKKVPLILPSQMGIVKLHNSCSIILILILRLLLINKIMKKNL